MSRRVLLIALLLTFSLTAVAPVESAIPPGFSDVVIFATNSAQVSRDARVESGDVVANDASPGPTLDEGVELAVDRNAHIAGNAKADSIDVDRGGAIKGQVSCNDGSGVSCAGLDLPVFAFFPTFQGSDPGPDDVSVGAGGSLTLAARSYRDVSVGEGGTLILSGGIYDFRSIEMAGGASLLANGPSDVRVAETFHVGANGVVGPGSPEVAASELVFYVGGPDPVGGSAFESEKDGTIAANIYTAIGTLELGQGADATGAFLGSDVLIKKDSTVNLDSFFFNKPPTADEQDVFTTGLIPIEITLTGSDPENDDLSFMIVSGPTIGNLGALVEDPPPFPGDPPGCNPENDPGCIPPDPPRTSATVTYTPKFEDEEDSFTFKVTDTAGNMDEAVVRINTGGDPEGEVEAFDTSVDTDLETLVTVGLTGDAPDGVSLTFDTTTVPANGVLSNLIQGNDDFPGRRAASVDYTPNAAFEGVDSFQFEACGIIGTVEVCATATATITVSAPDGGDPPPGEPPTADDQNIVVEMDEPVAISLTGSGGRQNPQALLLDGRPIPDPRIDEGTTEITASIGGNTADCFPLNNAEDACEGDGFGDNHNDNLPAVPKFVSAARNGSLASGNGSKGDARIHIEFDIDSLADLEIQSAEVKLTTHLGSIDSLDTDFFWIQAEGNGLLEDSDFEAAPAVAIPGSTLPVSVGNGTHTFDVTNELRQALLSELVYFSVQGRVDEGPADTARGLEVYTTCTCSLVSEWPQLIITTFEGVSLTYQIVSLPDLGTLTDSNGAPVAAGVDLPGPDLTYTPNPGVSGVDSFEFKVTDQFGQMAFATVTLTIIDPTGCEDCYTLEIVLQGTGVGDVTSNPNGIFCPGTCVAEFPQGSNVVLQARPIENGSFGGYGGDCSGSGPLLTVLMNGDKVCTATINAAP